MSPRRRPPSGRIVHEEEVAAELIHTKPPLSPGDVSLRTLIDRAVGCRNLVQRVLRIRGEVPFEPQRKSENVLYVVQGSAWFLLGDTAGDPLWPGTAFLVPPGTDCRVARTSAEELVLVSVLSPQPGARASAPATGSYEGPSVVREEDQSVIQAGDDRSFKLLIDPRHGARHVTQFVGIINSGWSPLHSHAYEEAIYVLAGGGVAHMDRRSQPIRPGSSIFLPPGTPHRLENPGKEELKVLGVFSPPGSPADMTEHPT